MHMKRKPNTNKRTTRIEPPTLDEAIFAAQGLSDDLAQQARIAAELIGLPEEEVRPHVQIHAQRPPTPRERFADRTAERPTVVVVRRRSRAPVADQARRSLGRGSAR